MHVGPGRTPFGAAPEALWRERRARLVALTRGRAMTIEHGGHLLGDLMTREVLARRRAISSPANGDQRRCCSPSWVMAYRLTTGKEVAQENITVALLASPEPGARSQKQENT